MIPPAAGDVVGGLRRGDSSADRKTLASTAAARHKMWIG
jgi:hypothetical protein